MNGWTASNSILRNQSIKNIKADIICLSETHLTGEQQLHVDDYTWMGWNRPLVHVNAPKGSGGVGILFLFILFVDYILSPQLSLKSCKLCKVQPVKELIEEFQLQHLIGERCRPPDHSVLSLIFVISSVPEVKQQYDVSLNKMYEANDEQMQTDSNCIFQRRNKLNSFPVDFQNNEIWSNALVEIISFLQTCKDTQQEIYIIYEKLCTTFDKEMATYLFPIKTTTGSKVKCKYYKPDWDEELSILWKNAIYNEKVFRKFKGSLRRKQDISLQYQISLRSFDKALRKKSTTLS